MGRVKEHDNLYKLQFEMPGVTKDEVKITVEDGFLVIRAEHKEEEEEGSDDERWSARSFGYYDTSLFLPSDAKIGEIKAELNNGVLTVLIPRAEQKAKDVTEIKVQWASLLNGLIQ